MLHTLTTAAFWAFGSSACSWRSGRRRRLSPLHRSRLGSRLASAMTNALAESIGTATMDSARMAVQTPCTATVSTAPTAQTVVDDVGMHPPQPRRPIHRSGQTTRLVSAPVLAPHAPAGGSRHPFVAVHSIFTTCPHSATWLGGRIATGQIRDTRRPAPQPGFVGRRQRFRPHHPRRHHHRQRPRASATTCARVRAGATITLVMATATTVVPGASRANANPEPTAKVCAWCRGCVFTLDPSRKKPVSHLC